MYNGRNEVTNTCAYSYIQDIISLGQSELYKGKCMKQIYLIGGTMGVGKTVTCQQLKAKLGNSVYLDGDWCWDMNPFVVNEETKKMVVKNITGVLNNFINCSVYNHIIFSWVMDEQIIINDLINRLNLEGCTIHKISLICRPAVLKEHLEKDVENGIRTIDIIDKAMGKLSKYLLLDTLKVDVSGFSPDETAVHIMENC